MTPASSLRRCDSAQSRSSMRVGSATATSLGHPYRSVGVGLRLGSKPLLGDGVFRLDFANPLDDVPGESDGWKVSASVGQVFTFGGNTSSWSSQ